MNQERKTIQHFVTLHARLEAVGLKDQGPKSVYRGLAWRLQWLYKPQGGRLSSYMIYITMVCL